MPQQQAINGAEFARRSESFSGELPVAGLERVAEELVATDGSVRFALSGSLGKRGEALLRLRVEGSLPMQCQRCMERYDHVLAIDMLFELLAAESELTQEEVEDDSRDYLPANGEIDVVALIEDEIILALPVAPRHESCVVQLAHGSSEEASRFSALAALKQGRH